MCSEILRAVAEFEGSVPRADDITLLILRREMNGKQTASDRVRRINPVIFLLFLSHDYLCL